MIGLVELAETRDQSLVLPRGEISRPQGVGIGRRRCEMFPEDTQPGIPQAGPRLIAAAPSRIVPMRWMAVE